MPLSQISRVSKAFSVLFALFLIEFVFCATPDVFHEIRELAQHVRSLDAGFIHIMHSLVSFCVFLECRHPDTVNAGNICLLGQFDLAGSFLLNT